MRLFFVALLVYLLGFGIIYLDNNQPTDKLLKLNQSTASIMAQLVQTKYFRLIRLNLQQECPLKIMNKICKSKSCHVCRCDDKDIPSFWSKTDEAVSKNTNKDIWEKERDQKSKSDWVWHVEDQENDEGEYFDIHTNIEAYTNYNGSLIWEMVYEQNCFQGKNKFQQMCHDEKILYRIISGLHTSISSHLSRFYRNKSTSIELAFGQSQIPFHFNHSEYKRRVLDHPERINNLFFIYQILAKAIKEISPYLMNNFTVQSDDIAEDLKSSLLLKEFLAQLNQFDLSTSEKQTLKFFTPQNSKVKEYQTYIHNISRILNCVQCQKCKLFGKMQTYGVGTALKILLGYKNPYKRNQIVALFNAFNKLTMSVDTYYQQRKENINLNHVKQAESNFQLYTYLGASFLLLIFIFSKIDISAKIKKNFKHVFPKGGKLKI